MFPSRTILTKALDHLMEQTEIDILRAAIVAKLQSGRVLVLGDDPGPDEGGIAGAAMGSALLCLGVASLGALSLPGELAVLTLTAAGTLGALLGGSTGRMASQVMDRVFQDKRVAALAAQLETGHPALVVHVRDAANALPLLRELLTPYNAEVIERVRLAA